MLQVFLEIIDASTFPNFTQHRMLPLCASLHCDGEGCREGATRPEVMRASLCQNSPSCGRSRGSETKQVSNLREEVQSPDSPKRPGREAQSTYIPVGTTLTPGYILHKYIYMEP